MDDDGGDGGGAGIDDNGDDVDNIAAAIAANNAFNDPTFSLVSHKIVQQNNVSSSINTHIEHKISSIESGSVSRNVVNRSGIDEIDDGNGKIREFIDYIEQIDSTTTPMEFQTDAGQSSTKHGYNSQQTRTYIDSTTDNESHDLAMEPIKREAYDKQSNDSHSQRTINNRKRNMFALAMHRNVSEESGENDENDGWQQQQALLRPAIRITPTEDERVQQFLCENCNEADINDMQAMGSGEHLRKSQTLQLLTFGDSSANDSDRDSESLTDSPLPNATRRESLLSEISSDSNQSVYKDDVQRSLSRENSYLFIQSQRIHERSTSPFAELEYIRGRDDWTDISSRYDIDQEVDSDNYHHLRRYSETAETLEYIRGREDWLKNEILQGNRSSLYGILERPESRFVIQDEIDSDEYHHNFFLHEHFRSASETMAQNDNHADQYIVKSCSTSEIPYFEQPTNVNEDTEPGRSAVAAVIEDFIRHERNTNDEIEITVVDLASDSAQVTDSKASDPFILISEATDDGRDASVEHNHGKQDKSNPLRIDSNSQVKTIDSDVDYNESIASNETQKDEDANELDDFVVVAKQPEPIENAMAVEKPDMSVKENKIDKNQSVNNDKQHIETKVKPPIKDPAKSQPSGSNQSKANTKLTNNPHKVKRLMQQSSLEELIQDASFGPWFHK